MTGLSPTSRPLLGEAVLLVVGLLPADEIALLAALAFAGVEGPAACQDAEADQYGRFHGGPPSGCNWIRCWLENAALVLGLGIFAGADVPLVDVEDYQYDEHDDEDQPRFGHGPEGGC